MLEINGMNFPLDRVYYTRDGAHIWLKQEDDLIKIGMDAFLVEYAGYLTFLTVNESRVKVGESIGSFESAKFVSRLYSPADGEIVAVNDEVIKNPRKINEAPYESWIFAVKADSAVLDGESEYLLDDEEKIVKWISEEIKKVEEDE
ncbi:MAG: glycine cleavage system protein H [Candidatus Thermoplasmatota archaeon]|nr:glycine cleavage system protein H [Candidatus Thermoplasmatota archaeon]MDP7266156.1 glycine cleavage system protein H [Candidatus Thermoplasmatota archaeon]MDP7421876.1 glycine cleavage system protein H [bacterium]